MRLLLDTHIWIWSLIEPERLSRRVSDALRAPANELWLSPISTWEAMMLMERGRVQVEGDSASWIEEALRIAPLREAPLTHEVAMRSVTLALPTSDPADRFLAASAAVHDLTLVTADKRLMRSKEFDVLPNR